ncbi:MAG: glycosyl transferase [Candidatus Hydrogenedentota bacterium]
MSLSNLDTALEAQATTERPMKFVFFPLACLLSHMGRCLEIGKALRDRGHEVVFAGERPDHPKTKIGVAVQHGFKTVYAQEPDYRYAWDRFEHYGWMATGWDLFRHNHWAPLDTILEETIRVIDEEKPDMVIGDASIAVTTAAYIRGIPASGVMNAYASVFLTPESPFSWMIRLWDATHLSRIRKRVYKKYGVKPVNAVALLRSVHLISPDLPGLYEPPKFFPDYHTVGPIYSEPSVPLPEWYDKLDDGSTNVYLTMGSTGLFDAFLRRNAEALGQLPYRFLVTTGGQVSEATIQSLPKNFLVTKYAPGSALMKKCQALVFHGGNGTTYQALEAGIPMVALPSHLEQDELVKIGVKHGYCIRLSSRRCTGPMLAQALQKLLNTPSYRESAQGYAERMRQCNGPATAAALLERLALEGKPCGWQFQPEHVKAMTTGQVTA